MAMVDVDSVSLQVNSLPKSFGTVLHSSNELGELSQWLCHDDSIINIGICIIIIIIIVNGYLP